jgi:hypothetical protein
MEIKKMFCAIPYFDAISSFKIAGKAVDPWQSPKVWQITSLLQGEK